MQCQRRFPSQTMKWPILGRGLSTGFSERGKYHEGLRGIAMAPDGSAQRGAGSGMAFNSLATTSSAPSPTVEVSTKKRIYIHGTD